MKKVIFIVLLIYLSIFCFLQISRKARLVEPLLEVNGQKIVYRETSSYHQSIIPFFLETKDTTSNHIDTIDNVLIGNSFLLHTNLNTDATMMIMLDHKTIYNGKVTENIGLLLQEEGNYSITITQEETFHIYSHQKNIFTFMLHIKKDTQVELHSKEVKRGSFATLQINHVGKEDQIYIKSNLPNQSEGQYVEDTLFIYYPIPLDYKLGSYELEVFNGNKSIGKFPIQVIKNDFLEKRQTNRFPVSLSDQHVEDIRTVFTHLLEKSMENRFWDNYFDWPVSGEIIRDFNDTAIIQQKVLKHSAIDIQAEVGTPVKSVAGGKVVYAAHTDALGNVVVVDHGHYLFTYYGHLETIQVKENEMIEKGNIVGTVGMEDQNSYLHFSIIFGPDNIPIDPWTFLKK